MSVLASHAAEQEQIKAAEVFKVCGQCVLPWTKFSLCLGPNVITLHVVEAVQRTKGYSFVPTAGYSTFGTDCSRSDNLLPSKTNLIHAHQDCFAIQISAWQLGFTANHTTSHGQMAVS